MQKVRLSVLLLSAAAMFPCSLAHAQNVDYSGFAELFGEPVTTSATGKPQRISDVPVSMEIIDAETIRRSGAIDIPAILERYAGMEVIRSFKGYADVNIRGYNQPLSNRILVLINGRQVYMDNFGTTIWASLPVQLSEIKQIEIVRGPNSSLFGFNAESGVINIVTFNPLDDDIGNLEGRAGTQAHREFSAVKTLKMNKDFAVRASGGFAQSDDYSRSKLGYATTEDDALDGKSYNLDGRYRISDRSNLRFEAGGNSLAVDMDAPMYPALVMDTVSRHLRGEFDYNAEKLGLITVQAYHNEVDAGLDATKFVIFAPFIQPTVNNRLNVLQVSDLISPSANHTFRFGGEYRQNVLAGDVVGTNDGSFTMDIAAANAMWEWRITDKISLTNSVRLDHWETDRDGGVGLIDSFLGVTAAQADRSENEYSYNSGLVYKATPLSFYRVSASRGLHIPSLIELSEAFSTPPLEVYGNPLLETESNETIELGYGRMIPKLNAEIKANVFHERVENAIVGTFRTLNVLGGTGGSLADFTFENAGDSSAYGIEVIASGKLPQYSLRWQGNYTYMLADDKPDGIADHYLDFAAVQPKHKANIDLGYTHDKFELDGGVGFVSGTDFRGTAASYTLPRREARVDSYFTSRLRAGYNFANGTAVSLDGYNLLDTHFERPTFFSDSRGDLGGNEIGRTVLLTVKHKF